MRRLLIVCTIVLGIQLVFPLSLQASVVANQQAEMVSLGTKDPSGKPGIRVDFDFPPVSVVLLVASERLDVLTSEHPLFEDVGLPTLLPVAGYHPSAP